jgi:membrane fusion protein, multidrug efflux system
MTDEIETNEPAGGKSGRRWALVGGGVVLAAAAGATYLGRDSDTQWSDLNTSAPAPEQKVAVAATKPATMSEATSDIRGVVKAKSEATIASRITARITYMPFKTGDSFGRGATLARFDCSTTRAQLTAARAATDAYRKTYDTNVELDQYQAVGKNDVAVSKANLGKASAEANAISTQLVDCQISAPFSGRVVEQIAHANEVAASGQPLMKIQSGGDLEVDLIVPSKWLIWMRPGVAFAFKIDETGETVKGQITRLGAAVDPVSKTIRVTGSLGGATTLVLPGMSGSGIFEQPASAPAATDGKPS